MSTSVWIRSAHSSNTCAFPLQTVIHTVFLLYNHPIYYIQSKCSRRDSHFNIQARVYLYFAFVVVFLSPPAPHFMVACSLIFHQLHHDEKSNSLLLWPVITCVSRSGDLFWLLLPSHLIPPRNKHVIN